VPDRTRLLCLHRRRPPVQGLVLGGVLFAALGQSSQSSRLLMELDRTLWLSIQANDSMKEDLLRACLAKRVDKQGESAPAQRFKTIRWSLQEKPKQEQGHVQGKRGDGQA